MEQQQVTDELKEWCATVTMRDMLFTLAEKENISYENALLEFTASPIYTALFDFETAIWKEGPDYLLDLYEEYKKNHRKAKEYANDEDILEISKRLLAKNREEYEVLAK